MRIRCLPRDPIDRPSVFHIDGDPCLTQSARSLMHHPPLETPAYRLSEPTAPTGPPNRGVIDGEELRLPRNPVPDLRAYAGSAGIPRSRRIRFECLLANVHSSVNGRCFASGIKVASRMCAMNNLASNGRSYGRNIRHEKLKFFSFSFFFTNRWSTRLSM